MFTPHLDKFWNKHKHKKGLQEIRTAIQTLSMKTSQQINFLQILLMVWI